MKRICGILLAVCFLFFVVTEGASNFGDEEKAVVAMEGAPPGVAWVVQMSDVHLSKWTPSRGRALRKALSQALKLIQPAIVVVSGDLVDAKSKDLRKTEQEEEEWIEYRDSFLQIAKESGISIHNFFDMRGNHDKYGVPLDSSLDYDSKYSISAVLNRTSLVQSVTVQGNDGRKHLFVGFDDSMKVGLRAPCNFFGHATDEVLSQFDKALKSWDDEQDAAPVTKIAYGHFPMSFTTSSETGQRVEDVMAANHVTAYVCGHLHTAFGRQLYLHHKERAGTFWEWEMGDWRISRMMRVMAIDQGHTSFTDLELLPIDDLAEGNVTTPTIILQTYPLDSRFMLPAPPAKPSPLSNSIRVLVFSPTVPDSVHAVIYETNTFPRQKVNSTLMTFSDANGANGAHYYTAYYDWQQHSLNGKYAIQIVAEINGGKSYSDMRFVSSSGEPGVFHLPPVAYLIFAVKWEKVVPFAKYGTVGLIISIFLASLFVYHWLERHGKYEDWMTSVFKPPTDISKLVKRPFAGLVEVYARNPLLWVFLVLYVTYLIFFPWFSGRVLADDYPIGRMSLTGWTVKPSNLDSAKELSGLGNPDNVVLVMSYFWFVVVPLVLLVSTFSAERAGFEIGMKSQGKCLKRNVRLGGSEESGAQNVDGERDEDDPLILRTGEGSGEGLERRLVGGTCRKCLVGSSVVLAFVFGKLCWTIGRALGFATLAYAPVCVWSVPLLLGYSFFQTSKIRCRCMRCLKP